MRIVTVSDLHIGLDEHGEYGIPTAHKASQIKGDILYFGGDLAEPFKEHPQRGWENFRKGLEILSKSPAPVKLFTLGNNDLEQLQDSMLTEHYSEMSERVQEYGFHLLDESPFVLGPIAFVGNVGWYDGSLWTPFSKDTHYPNDAKTIQQNALEYFSTQEFPNNLPEGLIPQQFFEHCKERLHTHLDEVHSNSSIEAVVLGIHYVPATSFVKGDNPEFAFLNWYMGSTSHADHYQRKKVILGFTGHTHRSDVRQVGKLEVHNLSGMDQPRVFELEKSSEGDYTSQRIS